MADCLSVNTDSFHLCVFSGVSTTEGPEENYFFVLVLITSAASVCANHVGIASSDKVRPVE